MKTAPNINETDGYKRNSILELCNEIKDCTKCDLCRTRKNAICGEGNISARIMLIAQAPGEKEDSEGRMFVGPSGKVLDELLNKANISRDEIYMTNLIKCHLPHNRKPKAEEIASCSYFLDREIELIKPQVLVPLGFFATRYIFHKYDLKIPQKKEFHEVYGKLIWTGAIKIFPLQHPVTVLYNPDLKKELEKSYRKLQILKRDCKWRFACPMTFYYQKSKLDRKWIELYCKGDWESCKRYQMEEKGIFHPDNMLPDGTIDDTLR